MKTIATFLLFLELCEFTISIKDDKTKPIDQRKLEKKKFDALTKVLLKGSDKKGYDYALMDAFANHTEATLEWMQKKKWSLIKGRLMCSSKKAAAKGSQGYASRKVECGKEVDQVWLAAFIVVNDDGVFYLAKKGNFENCPKATYTVTLSGESKGCLTDGFAEWGPDKERTNKKYTRLLELGELKYKEIDKKLPHIKGRLSCEKRIGKKKTEKKDIPAGETVMIIKNPSSGHCKGSGAAPWVDDFKVGKDSSFDIPNVEMYMFCGQVTYAFKLKNSKICDETYMALWQGEQKTQDLGNLVLTGLYEDDDEPEEKPKKEKSEGKKEKVEKEEKIEKPKVKDSVKGTLKSANKMFKKLFQK